MRSVEVCAPGCVSRLTSVGMTNCLSCRDTRRACASGAAPFRNAPSDALDEARATSVIGAHRPAALAEHDVGVETGARGARGHMRGGAAQARALDAPDAVRRTGCRGRGRRGTPRWRRRSPRSPRSSSATRGPPSRSCSAIARVMAATWPGVWCRKKPSPGSSHSASARSRPIPSSRSSSSAVSRHCAARSLRCARASFCARASWSCVKACRVP